MKTLEFKARVRNGAIKIPVSEQKKINEEVNVVLTWGETEKNYDPQKIQLILNKIKKKKIFDKIEDPVEWQRNLRNEW